VLKMKTFNDLMSRDKLILGLYVNMADCSVIEMAAYAGFDFVRIDMEHMLFDYTAVAGLIRTSNILDLPVQVRISSISDITKLLDHGASGIVVPDVNSVTKARELVELCKFYPLGKRGMFPLARNVRFGLDSFEEYLHMANNNVSLIIQIEDKEAMANIENILKVEGIDMVATGKADLSQSLGVPGQTQHKTVLEAENYIIKKALEFGKIPTIMASTRQRVQELIEMNVKVITTGDTSLLFKSFKAVLNEMR